MNSYFTQKIRDPVTRLKLHFQKMEGFLFLAELKERVLGESKVYIAPTQDHTVVRPSLRLYVYLQRGS